MAKGKRTRRTTVEEPLPEAPEFAELNEDELPPDVMKVLDELGADIAKVVLYRMTPGQKQAYISTITADEFDLDYVARLYGGGRYIARLVAAGGGFVRGVTFYIDESIKPERKPMLGEAAPGGGGAVTDGLLAKLLEAALLRPPQKDPMELAAALAAASATQAQAMMTAMTPLLSKITELASGGGQGGSGTDAGDVLEAVELGIKLGGRDEGYLPVIREVGVPLVKALETMMAQGKNAERPALNVGKGGDVAAATEAPWVATVRPYIDKIVGFATRNDDPALWATVLDRQYPQFAAWLEEAVLHAEFETQLYGHFPQLGPHRAWVHAFLEEFATEPEGTKGDGDAEHDD